MKESEKEPVSFYLRKDMVKELDKCAKSMHMNRSQFLEWLLTKSLPIAKKVKKAMDDAFTTVKEPE